MMQRGKTPSFKMDQMIPHRSSIERDTVHVLDFDKHVKRFVYEPFHIKTDKRGAGLLPDFEAEMVDGTKYLYECKPASKVDLPKNQEKFKRLKNWCHQNGYRFGVITDTQLRAGFLIKNINFLRRYANVPVPRSFREDVVRHLSSGKLRLDKLSERIPGETSQKMIRIYSLIYSGDIVVDIKNTPITLKSWVEMAS